MNESLLQLLHGFSLALTPENLLYALVGSLLGTLVGVLPGVGPVATIAVLLPITYQVQTPIGAIIMLAAIYYGAMYGGSTTSILLKVPGEAASVITCMDGYEMTRRGRAGPALAIAAIGSFIAGTFAVIALTFVGPMFAKFAVAFGPAEYFGLAVLGLALCASLSGGSPLKGLLMVFAGLLLGLVGIDTVTGVERFTFGTPELANGIQMIPMLMGLYGLGEILYSLGQKDENTSFNAKLGSILPSKAEWKESQGAIARGSVLGFIVGLIPGGGALLSSLLSYTVEKRLSKTPEAFGRGAIAGVAGPESANNASATSSFVPLFTLGLPGNAVTAVLFAALLIQNIQPGPMMLVRHADVFWAVIASMYVGNIMLLVLNLPLVGLWVQLLRVPFWILGAAVLVLGIFGAYSLQNSIFDVYILVISGVVGYLFRKADLDCAPLVMAFILANILDTSLRQALIKSDGSLSFIFSKPISFVLVTVAVLVLVTQLVRHLRQMGGSLPAKPEPGQA